MAGERMTLEKPRRARRRLASQRRPRVMFVNVGRAPRHDMLPEILDLVDAEIEVHERGALDDLSQDELNALRAGPGDTAISTFLTENIRVILSKPGIARRFETILSGLRPQEYDAVVILSTGLSYDFVSGCPTINAQEAMDAVVISLVARGATVGVIFPLASQAETDQLPTLADYRIIARAAREGDRAGLALAVLDLAEADVILLSSLGYSEADRDLVARATRKPVVLPRRAVAMALRLVLQPEPPVGAPQMSVATRERLERLTAREREVLALVCEGLSTKAIAKRLGISPKTVEFHRAGVMRKMEAPSLGALISKVLGAQTGDPAPGPEAGPFA